MEINRHNIKSIPKITPGDRIVFNTDNVYTVQRRYLRNDLCENDQVFRDLGVDKVSFCEKAYGYKPYNYGSSAFPECDIDDMEALLRVTKAIFEKLNPGLFDDGTFKVSLKMPSIKPKIIL